MVSAKLCKVVAPFLSLCLTTTPAFGQTCTNAGAGPCTRGCTQTQTCIQNVCCDNAAVTFGSTVSGQTIDPRYTTTAPGQFFTGFPGGFGSTGRTRVDCIDKVNPVTGVSDCPSRAELCEDSQYVNLMAQQCPRTCNKCSSTSNGNDNDSTGGCRDLANPATGVSDCHRLADLCHEPVYDALMRQQCPKTCGKCSGQATNKHSSSTFPNFNLP